MTKFRASVLIPLTLAAGFAGGCPRSATDPLDALAKSKIELVDAVASAEKAAPGGFPLEVELTVVDDKPCFDVEVMSDAGVRSLRIDGTSGDVVSTKDVQPSEDEKLVQQAIRQIDPSKRTSLRDAVKKALDKAKDGRPIEVDVDLNEKAAPAFEIRMLVNGDKWLEVVEIGEAGP